MQVNNQPNWSDTDIFTNYTFSELVQQARSKASPYYVYAQVILVSPTDYPNLRSYYDGISFRIFQRKMELIYDPEKKSRDILTTLNIAKVHYFAVKTFTIMNPILGQSLTLQYNQNLEETPFPPRFYSCPQEMPDEEMRHFAFDAVNFHSKDEKVVNRIKEIREFFCNYFALRSTQCTDCPDDKEIKKILEEEALIWKIGAIKQLTT